jgi:hypothetical protein
LYRRERRVTTMLIDGENTDADAFLAQVYNYELIFYIRTA